ncbi:uncharacterized protein LACBIDRAFT_316857 [Laccaria bicolor S238N-H82]|uniref:Predicted protein n=1 Tax=Laccaria bicolor (strain S238N-H82 / ATCC MYA-4686) TaxID=486041 RepID=B0E1R7_LACBS|nr:uncharacterized protein LACBIDRAFT_316857 [Laccaria bicolor S238N-H82]EDQ99243.1 predicted protein [Laccaria bicolor S238N-H82]|eukprot:XP_001890140.1 predicted protein [Laccaria bicolor S238N-H82]
MCEVRRVACVNHHILQLKHQVFIVFLIDCEEQAQRRRPPGYLERLAAISLLTRPRCFRSFRPRRGGLVEANCLLRCDVGTSRSGDSGPTTHTSSLHSIYVGKGNPATCLIIRLRWLENC